jgi:hypothetical protein
MMSEVLQFYQEHPSTQDALHVLLSKEPGIRAELPGIRQAMLGCCGAIQGKAGKIELVVADPEGWEELTRQQAAITAKLDCIKVMVEKLDAIFEEIKAAGIEIYTKSPSGIWSYEATKRTVVLHPDTGTNIDPFGSPVKAKRDPQIMAWAERAQTAFNEAAAIVG